jgi:hypothetical protein
MHGLHYRVAAHIKAVIRVQMAQADRIDLVEAGEPLQASKRSVPEIEHEPEAVGIN